MKKPRITKKPSITVCIIIERTGKKRKVEVCGSTVEDLLSQLKLNPEEIITVRNNTVVLPDETLKKNDTIRILSVISGG
jgi:thiamine biosynthesis protein ThiS